MSTHKDPSALERTTGNVVTESALTLLAAVAGGPLAPLLPVLAKSLAAERQKARVEQALSEINQVLQNHEADIRALNDAQYKIINETVLALLQTTHTEKLKFLRYAVENVLTIPEILPDEAVILSRIVRDISAEEATFLIRTFSYAGILLFALKEGQKPTLDDVLFVDPKSKDSLIVSGLLALGLLVPGDTTYGGPNILRYSALVAKLIALLRKPDA